MRNGWSGSGADRDDMRTPRRHRITRRHSEHVLDGLGGPDDLARLLADARRTPMSGELPGEAEALVAFRQYAVADTVPETRSLPVRTLTLSRALVVKVLAATTAVVAIGGVAAAATGNLPVTQHRHSIGTAAHPTASPTAKPTGAKDSDASRPANSAKDGRDHRHDLTAVGLCRAWVEVSKNAPHALTTSKAFQDLAKQAGGADKVAAYCDSLVQQWCTDHKWPTQMTAKWQDHPYLFRCVRPMPSKLPGPVEPPTKHRAPGTLPPGPAATPPHTPLPTGAPVRS